jgi:hypothetical protein
MSARHNAQPGGAAIVELSVASCVNAISTTLCSVRTSFITRPVSGYHRCLRRRTLRRVVTTLWLAVTMMSVSGNSLPTGTVYVVTTLP